MESRLQDPELIDPVNMTESQKHRLGGFLTKQLNKSFIEKSINKKQTKNILYYDQQDNPFKLSRNLIKIANRPGFYVISNETQDFLGVGASNLCRKIIGIITCRNKKAFFKPISKTVRIQNSNKLWNSIIEDDSDFPSQMEIEFRNQTGKKYYAEKLSLYENVKKISHLHEELPLIRKIEIEPKTMLKISSSKINSYDKIYSVMNFFAGSHPVEASEKKVSKKNSLNLEKLIAKSLAIIQAYTTQIEKYKIVHNDIKSDNIFVSKSEERYKANFIDYDLHQPLNQMPNYQGTLITMAPEILFNKKETTQPCSDIYSLGMTLIEIWNPILVIDNPLVIPDQETNFRLKKAYRELLETVNCFDPYLYNKKKSNYYIINLRYDYYVTNQISAEQSTLLTNIFSGMTQLDPEKRLSISAVKEMFTDLKNQMSKKLTKF